MCEPSTKMLPFCEFHLAISVSSCPESKPRLQLTKQKHYQQLNNSPPIIPCPDALRCSCPASAKCSLTRYCKERLLSFISRPPALRMAAVEPVAVQIHMPEHHVLKEKICVGQKGNETVSVPFFKAQETVTLVDFSSPAAVSPDLQCQAHSCCRCSRSRRRNFPLSHGTAEAGTDSPQRGSKR